MPGLGPTPNATPAQTEKANKLSEASSRLWEAARVGDANSVKQAIADGGDVNTVDLQNVSALLWAVKNKDANLVKALLAARADPNLVSQDSSPLHEAIRQHNTSLLDQLLSSGGNVNLQADFGKTLLHIAIQEDQWNIVDTLLAKRADPKINNEGGVTTLHFAAAVGNREGMQKLVGLKLPVDATNKNGKTPLHVASEKGHVDVIKVLLMANANTAAVDGWGRKPADCGKITAFKLISEHKPGTKYEFADLIADEPTKK